MREDFGVHGLSFHCNRKKSSVATDGFIIKIKMLKEKRDSKRGTAFFEFWVKPIFMGQ
jgi:hypothetical protein